MGKWHEYFSKKDIQKANRHMKIWSTSLIIREIKSKLQRGIVSHLSKMAEINHRCWECGERERLSYCGWEYKLVRPLWRTVWTFLKKLKIEPLYNPAIVLLGSYSQNTTILIRVPQCLYQHYQQQPNYGEPKYPTTDEWIKRMWYI